MGDYNFFLMSFMIEMRLEQYVSSKYVSSKILSGVFFFFSHYKIAP